MRIIVKKKRFEVVDKLPQVETEIGVKRAEGLSLISNRDFLTPFAKGGFPHWMGNPLSEIELSDIFYQLHSSKICFVEEAKCWYFFDGTIWMKDNNNAHTRELCKNFVRAIMQYAYTHKSKDKKFHKYAENIQKRSRRLGIMSDAESNSPKSLNEFDCNLDLLNCTNGTFNLSTMKFQKHNPSDYITKKTRVAYRPDISCVRWDQFISEIMCENKEIMKFLQKALGYSLSGHSPLECFFIFLGELTRNGKSTLVETFRYMLNDYADVVQPETFASRPKSGEKASPDIMKLRGTRFVTSPEPSQNMKIDTALIKQLTGGDSYTGRMLYKDNVTMEPNFKIFFNTNSMLNITDDTVSASGRVKVIPFERHFEPHERDTTLKSQFRDFENMSGILSWAINGHAMLQDEGLGIPEKINIFVNKYRTGASEVEAEIEKIIASLLELLNKNRDAHYNYDELQHFYDYHPEDFKCILSCEKLLVRGHYIDSPAFGQGNSGGAIKKALVAMELLLKGEIDCDFNTTSRNYMHRITMLQKLYPINYYAFNLKKLREYDTEPE